MDRFARTCVRPDGPGVSFAVTHRPRRLLAVLLVALGVCVPAHGALAATPPAGFFGLGNWSYPTASQSQQLGHAGLGSYRAGLPWDLVEHNQGTRNWYYVDTLMTQAAQDGYDVTLDINGCTVWACGATRVPPTPGAQQDAFENFVAAAVARYGANGSFWAAHPQLTRRTVSWQVWNEVNAGSDWPNPTPAAYAQLLALTSQTIKGVDPAATVVMSGLTEFPGDSSGQTLTQFLTGLYQQPGFASSFDVAAVHGYAESPAGVVRILDTAHKIMVANGDADKPLWITEMGWASGGPAHSFTTDPAGQASDLSTSFDQLLACRSRWNLGRVMWFSINDADPAAQGGSDYWGYHTGLLNTDDSPKPAYSAFTQYTSGQPLPDGRGDTCTLPPPGSDDPAPSPATTPETTPPPPAPTAPTPTITRAPRHLTRSMTAQVSFAAGSAVSGFQCSLDGGAWKPCVAPFVAHTSRQGTHTLAVRSVASDGTVSAAAAQTRWVVDRTRPRSRIRKQVSRGGREHLRITGRDAHGIAGYSCRVDGHVWTGCYSHVSLKLGPGRHVIQVRARDRAGNLQGRAARLVLRVAH